MNYKIIQAKSTAAMVVQVDKAGFLAEVQKLVDLSPVFKELADLKGLRWPAALQPPMLWSTLGHVVALVAASCSAVEIAKQSAIAQADPTGALGLKFDRTLALEIAVDLVAASLSFSGFMGTVIGRVWRPLLNVLVSVWVSGQPASWLNVALTILKIAIGG